MSRNKGLQDSPFNARCLLKCRDVGGQVSPPLITQLRCVSRPISDISSSTVGASAPLLGHLQCPSFSELSAIDGHVGLTTDPYASATSPTEASVPGSTHSAEPQVCPETAGTTVSQDRTPLACRVGRNFHTCFQGADFVGAGPTAGAAGAALRPSAVLAHARRRLTAPDMTKGHLDQFVMPHRSRRTDHRRQLSHRWSRRPDDRASAGLRARIKGAPSSRRSAMATPPLTRALRPALVLRHRLDGSPWPGESSPANVPPKRHGRSSNDCRQTMPFVRLPQVRGLSDCPRKACRAS